jgi:glycosyltransferase involved in cell wall biosynthesis
MIVRDEEQFLESCLRQVIPYVNRILIAVDSRSSDKTEEIVRKLVDEFPLKVFAEFPIIGDEDWMRDLGEIQNRQLKMTTEKWVWSLDGDEYYPTESLEQLRNKLNEDVVGDDGYAFYFWYLIDKKHFIRRKQFMGYLERIWRNKDTLIWRRYSPEDKSFYHLYDEKCQLHFRKTTRIKKIWEVQYIHFSRLKNWSWRKDSGNTTLPRSHYIKELPSWVINIVNKLT